MLMWLKLLANASSVTAITQGPCASCRPAASRHRHPDEPHRTCQKQWQRGLHRQRHEIEVPPAIQAYLTEQVGQVAAVVVRLDRDDAIDKILELPRQPQVREHHAEYVAAAPT